MALNLQPLEKIEDRFNDIKVKGNEDAKFVELCAYFEKNWIRSTVFPPESWCMYMQQERTNNDAEGWHTKLNVGHASKVNLFRLVEFLKEESDLIPLQAKLLCQNQVLRKQRKDTLSLHARLYALWDSYNVGTLKSFNLLEKCAELYHDCNQNISKAVIIQKPANESESEKEE